MKCPITLSTFAGDERRSPGNRRQRVLMVGAMMAAALTGIAGCGVTPRSSASAPSASLSGNLGQSYTTTSFKVPLTVVVEPLLKSPPMLETPGLLSWDALASTDEKVRFLVPVELYPPGSSTPQPPPANYLDYLRGQASHGAKFSNISTLTIDGHPATLMTATTTIGMDGSLGCPFIGADRGEGCYGFQPDLSLRIAVIDVGHANTLLAWARTSVSTPDDAFVSSFERMLASVHFK